MKSNIPYSCVCSPAALVFVVLNLHEQAVDYHVSLTGKDSNPGAADATFASLAVARDVARKFALRGGPDGRLQTSSMKLALMADHSVIHARRREAIKALIDHDQLARIVLTLPPCRNHAHTKAYVRP